MKKNFIPFFILIIAAAAAISSFVTYKIFHTDVKYADAPPEKAETAEKYIDVSCIEAGSNENGTLKLWKCSDYHDFPNFKCGSLYISVGERSFSVRCNDCEQHYPFEITGTLSVDRVLSYDDVHYAIISEPIFDETEYYIFDYRRGTIEKKVIPGKITPNDECGLDIKLIHIPSQETLTVKAEFDANMDFRYMTDSEMCRSKKSIIIESLYGRDYVIDNKAEFTILGSCLTGDDSILTFILMNNDEVCVILRTDGEIDAVDIVPVKYDSCIPYHT